MRRATRTLTCLVAFLAWAGQGGPPASAALAEPERLWTVGVQAFEDGLYDVTYRELGRFREVATADPRSGDAALLRGKSALALGWYPEALAEFEAAGSLPLRTFTAGEPLFWQAETLFRLRRYDAARDHYSQLLQHHPGSPYAAEALYARGLSELELGLPDESLASFDALLREYPASEVAGSAAYAAARERVRAKRWDQALALLSTYAARFPKSRFLAEAHYLLGVTQMEAGRAPEAVRTLEQFVTVHPRHELAGAARALVAEAHVKAGRGRDAVEQYRALVRETPGSPLVPQALYQIGELSEGLGRPQDAEAAWKALRRDHPQDPLAEPAGLGLVALYLRRRQFEPALEVARQMTQANGPQRLDALLLLGESALKAGKTSEAQSAYAAALTEAPAGSPSRFRALAGSGLAAEAQRDAGAARLAYQEIAERAQDPELVEWAKARIRTLEAREKTPARSAPRAKPGPKPTTGSPRGSRQ